MLRPKEWMRGPWLRRCLDVNEAGRPSANQVILAARHEAGVEGKEEAMGQQAEHETRGLMTKRELGIGNRRCRRSMKIVERCER